jgi:hypothetical protein
MEITFKNIYPTDDWKIIIELNDNSYRLLNYQDLGDDFSFCAYPNQLKAFDFSEKEILWKNGKSLNLTKTLNISTPVDINEVVHSSITVGMKNQAPTDQDNRHHVYYVSLYPLKTDKPIIIGESIGGGHGERGGCRSCSINELLELTIWKSHFELADCEWAIAIVERKSEDTSNVIKLISEGIRNKSNFN